MIVAGGRLTSQKRNDGVSYSGNCSRTILGNASPLADHRLLRCLMSIANYLSPTMCRMSKHVSTPVYSFSSIYPIYLVHSWKHRFTSECMNLLHDQAFGARTPSYATVLQLDRKMRAFPVPPILQVAGFGSTESRPGGYPESIMLTMQRHIVLAIRESSEYQ